MNDQATPPPEEKTNLPFDKAVIDELRVAVNASLTNHPELRSVAIALDFSGGLNDAPSIDKGLWVGKDGSVVQPAAIYGSIHATQNLLEVQFTRAVALSNDFREQTQIILETLKQKHEELDELEQRIAERNGELGTAAESAADSAE